MRERPALKEPTVLGVPQELMASTVQAGQRGLTEPPEPPERPGLTEVQLLRTTAEQQPLPG